MSAGKDFPGAVRQVVEKSSDPDDALVEEFSRMLQELGIGRTRKQALLGFAERAPIETVQEFVNSVVQAEEKRKSGGGCAADSGRNVAHAPHASAPSNKPPRRVCR